VITWIVLSTCGFSAASQGLPAGISKCQISRILNLESTRHQFGIDFTVTINFIVDGMVESLAFFVSKIHCIWYFQPNRVGNPMLW